MSTRFRLFAVDDVESARRVLVGAFSKDYEIEVFSTAEECLQRVRDSRPDLFLLDVDLPGMDGYTLCRQIKALPELASVPVIFISGLDDLESRLQGYDAGGSDFFVKPYRIAELRLKIEQARSALDARTNREKESEAMTSLVMANLDEYARLIQFLRALNACQTPREVADAVFGMLRGFEISGAIQFRLETQPELTLSADGENIPMEISIIHHVQAMGRVFEFKTRAAFNFPLVTVLINDMPVDDDELCGRVRDCLAIAVESANTKLEVIQAGFSRRETSNNPDMQDGIERMVNDFSRQYDQARQESTKVTERWLGELTNAFNCLGLSDDQERAVSQILRSCALELNGLYDFGDQTKAAFGQLRCAASPEKI